MEPYVKMPLGGVTASQSSIQNGAVELSGKHSKFIDQFLGLVLSRS
jgi:hypothetical protein